MLEELLITRYVDVTVRCLKSERNFSRLLQEMKDKRSNLMLRIKTNQPEIKSTACANPVEIQG